MKRISTVQGAKRRIEAYSQILAECSNQVSDNGQLERRMFTSTGSDLFLDSQVHTANYTHLQEYTCSSCQQFLISLKQVM